MEFTRICALKVLWVIGNDFVKAFEPSSRNLLRNKTSPDVFPVQFWIDVITAIPVLVALWRERNAEIAIIVGLISFGLIFATYSSIYSYIILVYTDKQKVTLNLGSITL